MRVPDTRANRPTARLLRRGILSAVLLGAAGALAALAAVQPSHRGLLGAAAGAGLILGIVAPWRGSGAGTRARNAAERIVANAADGILTVNRQGLLESFNPAAEQLFGYRADE